MIKYCSNKCFSWNCPRIFLFSISNKKEEKPSYSKRNIIMNDLLDCTMGFMLSVHYMLNWPQNSWEHGKGRFHRAKWSCPQVGPLLTPVGTAVCTRKYSPLEMRGRTGYFTGIPGKLGQKLTQWLLFILSLKILVHIFFLFSKHLARWWCWAKIVNLFIGHGWKLKWQVLKLNDAYVERALEGSTFSLCDLILTAVL